MNATGLLFPTDPAAITVLYLARHAPETLGGSMPTLRAAPLPGYEDYHRNVLADIAGLGYRVLSSSNPYAVLSAQEYGVDLVFSLLNRMPMRNPELLVPSLCASLGVACMGAPPNIRALAEDKYLSKQMFQALALPVSEGQPYRAGDPLIPPAFTGPYFVKDRFGAASEGIDDDSLQETWEGASRVVTRLQAQGREPMVERYCEGMDITVPVLVGVGCSGHQILGFVAPQSNKRGGILTADLKVDDHLGNRLLQPERGLADAITHDIAAIARALGPIDYFRVDYRWNPQTGCRTILEINICCYLGRGGAVCMTAAQQGIDRPQLLAHIIEFSQRRQAGR